METKLDTETRPADPTPADPQVVTTRIAVVLEYAIEQGADFDAADLHTLVVAKIRETCTRVRVVSSTEIGE